jgi:hypothetical protein
MRDMEMPLTVEQILTFTVKRQEARILALEESVERLLKVEEKLNRILHEFSRMTGEI